MAHDLPPEKLDRDHPITPKMIFELSDNVRCQKGPYPVHEHLYGITLADLVLPKLNCTCRLGQVTTVVVPQAQRTAVPICHMRLARVGRV